MEILLFAHNVWPEKRISGVMSNVTNCVPESLQRPLALLPYLDVELLEFLQIEDTCGTVFQEAFVPLLQFLLIKFCAPHQIIQHLWSQFTVVLAHCRFWKTTTWSTVKMPNAQSYKRSPQRVPSPIPAGNNGLQEGAHRAKKSPKYENCLTCVYF